MDKTEQEMRASVMALIARTKAMEYAIWTLIWSHPDRERARTMWASLLPKIVDGHLDGVGKDSPHFHDEMQRTLAEISRAMDAEGFD